MNEEFKKKYLKYKIKYLELIGGGEETTLPQNIKPFEELRALIKAAETAEATAEAIGALNTAVAQVAQVAEAIGQQLTPPTPKEDTPADEQAVGKLINIMVTNIEELQQYKDNIKEYIKDKHIDKIFKGDQLYKLFIFIVVEFGKLLNCENESEMKTMNKLLYPPHLVIK